MSRNDVGDWQHRRVVVVADGELGQAVWTALTDSGLQSCVLSRPGSAAQMKTAMAGAAMMICALEDPAWIRPLNDAACAARVVITFLRALDDRMILGPTVVPTRSPCFRCSESEPRDPGEPPDAITPLCGPPRRSLEAKAREAIALLSLREEVENVLRGGSPGLLAGTVTITSDLARVQQVIRIREGCPSCTSPADDGHPAVDPTLAEFAQLETDLAALWDYESSMIQRDVSEYTEFKTVGVIGGGTAGYLAALTLRRLRPDLRVTLIESSSIPVIGVGEATVFTILPFLHVILGLDILQFYEVVRPTFKLGIRFEWGLPGNHHFNYPFDSGRVMESQTHHGHLHNVSLGSTLMDHGKAPVGLCADEPYSLLGILPYAYHLDNQPFIKYLAQQAARVGIAHLDRQIVDAVVSADGGSIDYLVDRDGERHRFDLFVDCSGFRSLLLGKTLGTEFINFGGSLFTDSAVVATVPNDGVVQPYTTAETMDNGWCWNIPVMHENHRGYVFASAFCTPEQAEAEMRAKNPRMTDPWLVRFRSGRHEKFFRGNVVAIGNAYGFVEPLESTAIEGIMYECLLLARLLPRGPRDEAGQALLNDLIGKQWDIVRWFLAIHYKFNRRIDSRFWRECQQSVDISGAQHYVDLFRQGGPFSSRGAEAMRRYVGLNPFAIDVLLVGQGLHEGADIVPPLESSADARRRAASFTGVADRCLDHRAALELLVKRPELLYEQLEQENGWIGRVAQTVGRG